MIRSRYGGKGGTWRTEILRKWANSYSSTIWMHLKLVGKLSDLREAPCRRSMGVHTLNLT
ncbi:hypothetical protein PAXRUDRAFT_824293 [Paxillus rubicundulus Ve08.2h10]|uniref:Uncharacterized protein n=1 Tax=Paxillus rubicundulus Ve08.2h10 TaxID=930991 RepID=A0A0D0DUL6_9AGAM|nr:hypothetical protein PAXRUDRAFT_824293 [Paxillus rubicundulus Ve08.2h10]